MDDLFFSKRSLQKFILHTKLRNHLLQMPIFVIQRLHLQNHRCVHAAIFRAPFVKCGQTHLVFPAKRLVNHAEKILLFFIPLISGELPTVIDFIHSVHIVITAI